MIINKGKHFNKLTEELFNMSMRDIRELNVILTPCGAKPYIEQDKEKFVTITFLYVLFLQECVLQRKYCPKYQSEISTVLDTMIYQIANRFGYVPQKLKNLYLDVRQMLDKMSNDDEVIKTGLYYSFAIHYLHLVFSGEYIAENSPFKDDTPYVMVGNFFRDAINRYREYSK